MAVGEHTKEMTELLYNQLMAETVQLCRAATVETLRVVQRDADQCKSLAEFSEHLSSAIERLVPK